MRLLLVALMVVVSGCVTTIHHDITTVPTLEEPVSKKPTVKTVTSQPKTVVRYKDRIVTQSSTCRFKLPELAPMPPVLLINDNASVKDRERDMALYIKTMRSYTTMTLAKIQQQYADYNRNCK